MQEFEVEEKKPAHREYFMLFSAGLQGVADALKELDYNPDSKKIPIILDFLKQKTKELEEWS
jgi:hypothetical protein